MSSARWTAAMAVVLTSVVPAFTAGAGSAAPPPDTASILASAVRDIDSGEPDRVLAGFGAVEKLGPAGHPATAAVARHFGDADPRVREAAPFAFLQGGGSRAEALPALVAGLTDPDRLVRDGIRSGLLGVAWADSQLLAALRAALEDSDLPLRAHAVGGFVRAGGDVALGLRVLRELFAGHSAEVHWRAAASLAVVARIDPEASTPELRALLRDPRSGIREEAASQVAWAWPTHDASLMAALFDRVHADPEPRVRFAAASTLVHFCESDDESIAVLIRWIHDQPGMALPSLGDLGPRALAAASVLRELSISDPDEDIRRRAADALRKVELDAAGVAEARAALERGNDALPSRYPRCLFSDRAAACVAK